jgi:hypothetical protein
MAQLPKIPPQEPVQLIQSGVAGDRIDREGYSVVMKWRPKSMMALAKFRMRLAKLFR